MKEREGMLVVGGRGLVGSRFVEVYGGARYNLSVPSREELDITSPESVKRNIEKRPAVIVNFAACTNVGEAEKQRGDKDGVCWQLNVEAVGNLASAVDGDGGHFVQISTDMVFAGSGEDPGPYAEDHVPEMDSERVTWYGFTKAEGERVIWSVLGNKATILRIIYPVRAKFDRKLDYLRKPLQLFDQGKLYPMFSDQQVSIAFIDEVCEALGKIIDGGHRGIYHVSSRDTTTPFELMSYLVEGARGKVDVVKSAVLVEFLKQVDNPVRYPIYGGLKVEKTEEELGMRFGTWGKIVDKLIAQGLGK